MYNMKYWLFDRSRLKLDHMQKITEEGWRELQAKSTALLEILATENFPVFVLR